MYAGMSACQQQFNRTNVPQTIYHSYTAQCRKNMNICVHFTYLFYRRNDISSPKKVCVI